MSAEDAFAGGSEAFDGALRNRVTSVGFELHPFTAERFKAVGEQQEFGGGIERRAMNGGSEPSISDFEGAFGWSNIEQAGGADSGLGGLIHDGKGHALAGQFIVQCVGNPVHTIHGRGEGWRGLELEVRMAVPGVKKIRSMGRPEGFQRDPAIRQGYGSAGKSRFAHPELWAAFTPMANRRSPSSSVTVGQPKLSRTKPL